MMVKLIKSKIFNRNMENYEIDMQELKEKQKNGAVIVDVRSSQEYSEGHINEAINIPYYEIKKNVNKVLNNKNQDIVLYCQTGFRSKQAYKKLSKLEYKNLYNLYGGLDNWV